MAVSQIVLGTAQLGMDYGIANAMGRPSGEAARRIVQTAWLNGIRCFDTAQAYGVSETVLGDALSLCADSRPEIVSKLAANVSVNDVDAVMMAVHGSLKRLRTERLWGLMLHDEEALDAWVDGKARGLDALKDSGLVEHLGISVYSAERAIDALGFDEVTIIQVPANLFDRRMARAGVFEKAASLQKTVFVRSVFLQGLVFLTPNVANRIPNGRKAVLALHDFCSRNQLDVRSFSMHHVCYGAPGAQLVVGAETAVQVGENCRAFADVMPAPSIHEEWNQLWPNDYIELLDPRRWPKK
ncbi:MAG: aldo/keto reductase [Nibricoccus sp.]